MKKAIVRMAFIFTVMSLITLCVKGYQLNKLVKKVDFQIIRDKHELTLQKSQLKKLEKEITEMNTPAYIEKVAREELGMVKEEDIVFREKKQP